MDNPLASSQSDRDHSPVELTAEKTLQVLWDTAWEAAVLAFLVQILGGVAVSILGEICSHMIPTLPPGIAEPSFPATRNVGRAVGAFVHHHRFVLLFSVFFVGKLAGTVHSPGSHRWASPGRKRGTAHLPAALRGLV